MSNIISQVEAFVEKEVQAVEGIFKKGVNELVTVAEHAAVILNAVKAEIATPTGQTILGIVEQLPVVGIYAEDIVNKIIPGALTAIGVIEQFPTETFTDAEKAIADGVGAIFGKTAEDATTLAFNSVASFIANKIAPLFKVASTIQATLSVQQAAYSSTK